MQKSIITSINPALDVIKMNSSIRGQCLENQALIFIDSDDLAGFIDFCTKKNLSIDEIAKWKFMVDKRTLLHVSIGYCAIKILKHLIKVGFPINSVDGLQYSALHYVVFLYLDISDKTHGESKWTALSESSSDPSIESFKEVGRKICLDFLNMAQILIDACIDTSAKNNEKYTAYEMALRKLPLTKEMFLLLINNNAVSELSGEYCTQYIFADNFDNKNNAVLHDGGNAVSRLLVGLKKKYILDDTNVFDFFDHANVVKFFFSRINKTLQDDALAVTINKIPSSAPIHDERKLYESELYNEQSHEALLSRGLLGKLLSNHELSCKCELIQKILYSITKSHKAISAYRLMWMKYIKLLEDTLLPNNTVETELHECPERPLDLLYDNNTKMHIIKFHVWAKHGAIQNSEDFECCQPYTLKNCILKTVAAGLRPNLGVYREEKDMFPICATILHHTYDKDFEELDKVHDQHSSAFKSDLMTLIDYVGCCKAVYIAKEACKQSKARFDSIEQSKILESEVSTSVTNPDLEGASAVFETTIESL